MVNKTSKIKKITPIGVKNVWDITVEQDHSYVGNGIVHHNSAPNMTNYVAAIRGQHLPREGYVFLQFDLSQAEMRVVAALSQDAKLMEALYSEDFHKATAAQVWDKPIEEVTKQERQICKILNFAILYGASAFKIAKFIGTTVEEAEDFIEQYMARFEGLKAWMAKTLEDAHSNLYVETPFGTRLHLRNLNSIDMKVRSHAERVAVNAPVQGGAGEYCFWLVEEQLPMFEDYGLTDIHLVNVTHDYVCYEVPKKYFSNLQPVLDPDTGEDTGKLTGDGLAYDIVFASVNTMTCPVYPLNTVKFAADVEISSYFYEKPNLMKAIDPKFGTDKQLMAWHLLKVSEEHLDEEQQQELDEMEEMESVYNESKQRA